MCVFVCVCVCVCVCGVCVCVCVCVCERLAKVLQNKGGREIFINTFMTEVPTI